MWKRKIFDTLVRIWKESDIHITHQSRKVCRDMSEKSNAEFRKFNKYFDANSVSTFEKFWFILYARVNRYLKIILNYRKWFLKIWNKSATLRKEWFCAKSSLSARRFYIHAHTSAAISLRFYRFHIELLKFITESFFFRLLSPVAGKLLLLQIFWFLSGNRRP